MRLLTLLVALLSLAWPSFATAADTPLTFHRLFTAPGLDGPHLGMLKFAPDGSRIAYLKGSAAEPRRLDLWLYDSASKEHRLVVAAASLPAPSAPDTGSGTETGIDAKGDARGSMDADERSQRERQRVSDSGIVAFAWAPASDALLFPWNGQAYVYRPADNTLETLTAPAGPMVNPALSPKSNRLAYVAGNDLYVQDLTNGKHKRLTKSTDPLIRYGVAEFVAAEEIGRDTGFWWSPDGQLLAVIETDARPVVLRERYEALADGWRVNREPYPQAGQPNVRVRVAVIDAKSGRKRWLDLGETPDFYLTRVKWLYDGSGFLVIRQSRDQKTVDVLLFGRAGDNRGTLIHETSPTWVNLHDDLLELADSPAVLWGSDRDGPHRIYRYGKAGVLEGALTPMDLYVDGIVSADEEKGKLYVEGYMDDPRERHLYSVDLDPQTADRPERLTLDAGLHRITFSPDGTRILDRYSSPAVPFLVTLRAVDGGTPETLIDGRITANHPYSPYLAAHVPPQFGSLTAADGSKLYYRLLLPRGLAPGQRAPVLVHLYGGPGFQMVTKSWGPLWQQAALARGYAIFTLDNRGSARRGKAFEEALYHKLGSVEVADQMAGIAYLKTRLDIDPERIAVFGWSYGGYLALKVGEAAGDGIRGVIAGAPVTDWRLYDSHYTERYLGLPQDDPARYDASSVFPDLANLKAPLLLIHGLADDNVLFTHSTRLMAALQARAQPFAAMPYPGATHALREPVLKEHLYETIFRFLDEKMQQVPEPAGPVTPARGR